MESKLFQPQSLKEVREFERWLATMSDSSRLINGGPHIGFITEKRIPLDGVRKVLGEPVEYHYPKWIKPMIGDLIEIAPDGNRIYVKRQIRVIVDADQMWTIARMVEEADAKREEREPKTMTFSEAFEKMVRGMFVVHRRENPRWFHPNWFWIRTEDGSLRQG